MSRYFLSSLLLPCCYPVFDTGKQQGSSREERRKVEELTYHLVQAIGLRKSVWLQAAQQPVWLASSIRWG